MQVKIVAQEPDIVTTELDFNPRNHLFALYRDGEGFRAIVRWYGQNEGLDLSDETGQAIYGRMILDDAVEDAEGYDDDPEAEIAWLHPNGYIALMNQEEQEQVRAIQWKLQPQIELKRRNPITGHFLGGGRGQ